MAYYEITISAPDESREAIMNRLAEMGSTGFLEKKKNPCLFRWRRSISPAS
jgi:hypothetical protein